MEGWVKLWHSTMGITSKHRCPKWRCLSLSYSSAAPVNKWIEIGTFSIWFFWCLSHLSLDDSCVSGLSCQMALCLYPVLLAYQLHALPCGSSHRPLSPGTACRVDNGEGLRNWRTKLVLCRENYPQRGCAVAHAFTLVTQTNFHTPPPNLPPCTQCFSYICQGWVLVW